LFLKKLVVSGIVRQKVPLDAQVLRYVRFIAPAQTATISPPIGPILGQFGINIMDFCRQFNEKSKYIEVDTLVTVNLTLFKNKSFSFVIKTPPFSFLVNEENFELEEDLIPSFINLSSIYKIYKIKRYDSPLSDIALARSFFGTIRSMHVKVCFDLDFAN
jgi:large subunit ribosomal protein L11